MAVDPARRFEPALNEFAAAFVSLRNAISRSHLHGDPHTQEVLERVRVAIMDLTDLLGLGDLVDRHHESERKRRGGA